MAPRKKKNSVDTHNSLADNAYISGAGTVMERQITETLETNYMPYAMSVIMSRAIPEIDGFKPSHRKLLYTMYLMGLLGSQRIKSANIVGRTMQLNPHGDAAIYETMVRLAEGYQALLHHYVDSKGNFGKAYSRDMAYAASRYTEAKLSPIANELFNDINKETVDFVDNYDSTMKEPTLFPVTFPSVLVNANTGIAVGMASSICPFNLEEVCRTTIAYIKDNDCDICDTLLAPDFPIGGELVYDRAQLEEIYRTGRGSFKVRAVYNYDKDANCIDITEIPPTTTVEAIIEKVIELCKNKKIQDIKDIRDETGLSGLRITIDLKNRTVDPDKLMAKLFKSTPLMDSFSCNFNILIASTPKVMGVREILSEWTAYRVECVKRRVYFDLNKAKEKYHLLQGLAKILLDIDKAIKIVRETAEEKEVVPNLMIGFGIDEVQAEYVAEIKLRHLNREYILKRTSEMENLEKEIEKLEGILSSRQKVYNIIISELENVIKKYGKPRCTKIVSGDDITLDVPEEEIQDYPVTVFITKDGYFKKITPLSLRMGGEHKLKEGDEIISTIETSNTAELLFFTDKHQVYKAKANDFDDTKASALGEFVASKLDFEDGENLVYTAVFSKYEGYMMFFFKNGRVSKVPMKAYETKTNRKKLINAYCDKYEFADAVYIPADCEVMLKSSSGRMLLLHSGALQAKTTKDNGGVAVMTQKKGQQLVKVAIYDGSIAKPHRYRTRTLPALGSMPLAEDEGASQLSLI